MPSPFPGMNPYLEQNDVWSDFHQSFIPFVREIVAGQVRPNYLVKVEERIDVHDISDDEKYFLGRSDISVAKADRTGGAPATSTAVADAPTYGRLPAIADTERSSYVEIRDRQSRELITVIELLSPSNKKPGVDREQYLAERRELIASSVHLVELDLLRGGMRLPAEDLPDCDYCVLVSRAEERPRVGIWPLRLRDPLPEIPIPLKSQDPDARLDLKQALDRVYDAAGYEDYIYTGTPQPPVHPQDAQWAREFVPQRPE